MVIWNSQSNDGSQELKTYDIQNRNYTTIADGEGVTVVNPRMVVVYEATYKNGDVVTKGYDLVTGEIVPLESLPRQLPAELPDSDSTGETRALIQPKPEESSDAEVEENQKIPPSTGTTTLPVADDTLDLRPATSTDEQLEAQTEDSSVLDILIWWYHHHNQPLLQLQVHSSSKKPFKCRVS